MATAKLPKSALPGHLDAKLQWLKPDHVLFDSANPRFGQGHRASVKQATLYKELLDDPHNATALVESFVENGFIQYEPLIVKPKNSEYVVIEGNRRLAAVKYIRANGDRYGDEVVSRLEKIPCLVFPEDAPEESQRTYLGVRHLLGFREWPALSKAMFLDQQAAQAGNLSKLLKEISLTKQDARRFLIPFRLFKKLNLKQLPDGQDFWVLAEAINRAGIKEFIELDVDPATLQVLSFNKANLEELLTMLYGPAATDGTRDSSKKIIEETRDLTKLAKVLSSKPATAALRKKKDLEEAILYVEDDKSGLVQKLEKEVSQIRVLVTRLKPEKASAEYEALKKVTTDLEKAVKQFKAKK
jgi:hypothetical protein